MSLLALTTAGTIAAALADDIKLAGIIAIVGIMAAVVCARAWAYLRDSGKDN